jgi:hypothetical protein
MSRKFQTTILIITLSLYACASAPEHPELATRCTDPRPEVCTANYLPVCGVRSDQTTKTYANACSACSDLDVAGHNPGECPKASEKD